MITMFSNKGLPLHRVVFVTQSCLTLCEPPDCSPPGSSVHMVFSRQEYWNGLALPSTEDLPGPGIEPRSPALQADSLLFGLSGKESNCQEGDADSILGSGRSSGKGNGSPLQYSSLENTMDRRAWWATVHGVAKN